MSGADRLPKIRFVRNAGGYWKWQLWSANGRAMICESKSYLRAAHAVASAEALPSIAASAVLALPEGGGT